MEGQKEKERLAIVPIQPNREILKALNPSFFLRSINSAVVKKTSAIRSNMLIFSIIIIRLDLQFNTSHW